MNEALRGMVKGLLIVIVLAAVCYAISYRMWLNAGFGNEIIEYKDEDDNNVDKDSKPDVIEYKKLYEKVNYSFVQKNFGSEFYDMYYENKPFTSDFYIYLAVINIINTENTDSCLIERNIASVEVELKIKEIFGLVAYENKSFTTKDGGLEIKYNKETDSYSVRVNKCRDYDFKNGGVYTALTGYSTEGGNLYIEEMAVYLNYTYSSNGYLIFNYHQSLSKDSPVIANDVDSLSPDAVGKYRLVFKKENNNYVFTGVRN